MAINFFKRYLFEVKIALVTAAAVILFEVINLFVLYGYMRMDFYVSLAAVCFLAIGMLMGRKKQAATNHAPNVTQVPELLTAREKQILSLIMQGKTNKEIAAVNFIEISTVKTHLNNIYAKLAVTNRKEACAKYAQMPKNR